MANGWAQQKFRVVGSAYTLFYYGGEAIYGCEQIADQPPRPVNQPEAVQPLDEKHPIEIAFPRAAGAGMLVLSIKEQWDKEVWRMFPGFRDGQINDIVDLFERSVAQGQVACTKLIVPPPGHPPRKVIYHGCVITDADFGDNIAIAAMTVNRVVQIMYTHTTRQGG